MIRRAGLSALVVLFLTGTFAPFLQAQRERSIEEEILTGIAETVRRTAAEAIDKTVLIEIRVMGQDGFGSGAIVSEDGHILTCAHVVEPGESLTVVTSDGRRYPARKLGMNAINDYALIKIDATDLPHFEIGDSDEVRVRDWVVALGHPGGPYPDFDPAVAVGRVRGLHQQVPVQLGQKYYDDAIQSDCPIFGGNSGGPLVTLEGKLVGINGAINPASDSSYSIPTREILADLEALKEGRNVQGRSGRGGFGDIAQAFGETDRTASLDAEIAFEGGRLVLSNVQKDGTAHMSGLAHGDVVTHVAGMAVGSAEDLSRVLGYFRRGESTLFEVVRDGVSTPVVVTFGFRGVEREPILRRGLFHLGLEAARSTVKVLVDGAPVGYGVVLDPEGWIATCERLVGGSDRVAVQVYGGEEFPARVVGREGRLDVALLSIDPGDHELVAVETGEDASLAPGDWVLSGGDYRGPLAVGAVSAIGREVGADRKIPSLGLFDFFGGGSAGGGMRPYPEVVQHDSTLSAGHFGSPLFDLEGRLVGINVANVHRGTSYAVPIHRILGVVEELKGGLVVEGPKVYTPQGDGMAELFRQFFGGGRDRAPAPDPDSPFLGIQVDQTRAVERGVLVGEVIEGSAASRAGLRPGDVIVGLADRETATFEDLVAAIRRRKAGDEVQVKFLRDGAEREVAVTLGRRGDPR